MSDGQMSLNDVLNAAIQADNNGVPVDWKQLAMTIYNVATNHIAQMEADEEADDEAA